VNWRVVVLPEFYADLEEVEEETRTVVVIALIHAARYERVLQRPVQGL